MTELATRLPSARLGEAMPFLMISSFPTTWMIASCGSRSRVSTIVSMLSTISAPALVRHARSPGACSREQRSCVNATAHASTSPPERRSTARRPRRSTCTRCKRLKAAFESERDLSTKLHGALVRHCYETFSLPSLRRTSHPDARTRAVSSDHDQINGRRSLVSASASETT